MDAGSTLSCCCALFGHGRLRNGGLFEFSRGEGTGIIQRVNRVSRYSYCCLWWWRIDAPDVVGAASM